MSTVAGAGVGLSQNYFLRNFYISNQSACKNSKRSDFSKSSLSNEDAMALHRAAKKLSSYAYNEDDNEENVKNSILAYIDTYNNTVDSASKSGNHDVERYSKQLKKLSKKYSSELEAIGITVKSDGTMEAKKSMLDSVSMSKIKKAFGSDSELVSTTFRYTKKLQSKTSEALYAQLTGAGNNINLSL